MHPGCPMGMNPAPTFLCTALARLKEEHGPLVEKMMELKKQSKQFADAQALFKEELLQDLQEKAADFIAQLEPHSEKEEAVLFPMLATYIGRETGPIAVMEYEHELFPHGPADVDRWGKTRALGQNEGHPLKRMAFLHR
ncbi:MAG: hemerythrin [Brevibacillus sp.]|nr:hemerythrin [Brevibacillus sp.]